MMKFRLLSVVSVAVLLSSCAMLGGSGNSSSAQIKPTAGNNASGTVNFHQEGDKLVVAVQMVGLKTGPHGFHIHEKGDCSAPDGMSAGGHFNPMGKQHGHPNRGEHHAGDIHELYADANGNANMMVNLDMAAIGKSVSDIVGRSVVVHAGPDDFKSQPAGNSGARVACGVIVDR